MRNVTKDAIFDDMLPIGDGYLKSETGFHGFRVAMESWFRQELS